MKITLTSSRLVKPAYNGNPPLKPQHVPLSLFDKVACKDHVGAVYIFSPPTPSSENIIEGLSIVLSLYWELAGRLGTDDMGNTVILLNDEGARLVEASADVDLQNVLTSQPSKDIESLYPSIQGVKELAQVQITRFTCGSLLLAFTADHQVADGHAITNFLVAWSQATRGISMGSVPLHDRGILFKPRHPPLVQYEHRGVEYITKSYSTSSISCNDHQAMNVTIHKVHFTKEFTERLQAKASYGASKSYSTFETILAHLWRVITNVRCLPGHETTHIRISVNGRRRMNPKVPNEFFGNLVLWAFPHCKVRQLIAQPLQFAAELIHDAVRKVDDSYFKSFIDFSSSGVIEKEALVPRTTLNERVQSPNLEVHSWVTFPFRQMNFGTGKPDCIIPGYLSTEGELFFIPSCTGDGSIDVYVPLFLSNLDNFKKLCYALESKY
ncbi:hypothetical protein LUZ61_016299 [Rhynchospora tenuis]|uniref:Acyltransferase n=1 Tax=Rhynchospora tenuis TaxID=198213 RepID=A0AAD6EJT4_9POAL|nr:hypothetical protein LUZ61_016299 [Rhynchospora tenuis]